MIVHKFGTPKTEESNPITDTKANMTFDGMQ